MLLKESLFDVFASCCFILLLPTVHFHIFVLVMYSVKLADTFIFFYLQGIDLEPIDFEHFIDEPELERPNMERMFR